MPSEQEPQQPGLRFNENKLRFDLLHPTAQEGIVKVLTSGSIKYAPRNWEKGMSWSSVIASLKRHLNAFEKGEDYDHETGLLHIDHLQCNAHFLSAYYKIAPQWDDRNHSYLKNRKIGLDIDDVICDFVPAFISKFNLQVPTNWNFRYDTMDKLKEVTKDKDFYLSLKPKTRPEDIPFEPHAYITSRSIPKEWTEEWLQKNGYSCKPVYVVDYNHSKVEVAKQSGIDIFVDDKYENFLELNNAGINTYLFDAPWNQRYNVGYKRIKSLKELL